MECLCDELLQLIFYELSDPCALTMVSRRFYRFSQDPYVRAHYFLHQYGPLEAIYYAMGRGKLVTERVIDILLSSGAHLSRYLIQVASHHYFHTQTHFIKSTWVRHVPLRVIAYVLQIAEKKYGEIPFGKGEDDGSLFNVFLKESRLPAQIKSVTWETVRGLMETYNFIPFSNKDPIMAQFPLALAIEPRLLPYAVANGFSLDYKYRDFVFRKMFERPSPSSDVQSQDIAENVRELCKLDSSMFVTRTVAAEVCMEAKINEVGYSALKELDKSGHLRFDVLNLVEDLLRTFLNTRSISTVGIQEVILHLFNDFPSSDVTVRLVILVVIFLQAENMHWSCATIRTKLENLGLASVTKKDIANILINPFVEKYSHILDYATREISVHGDGTKGMSSKEVKSLVEDVAVKCLAVACKGKLLKRFVDEFPDLQHTLAQHVLQRYQVQLEDLPSWEDGAERTFHTTSLCRDFTRYGVGEMYTYTPESLTPDDFKNDPESSVIHDLPEEETYKDEKKTAHLGHITQETLTTMIRIDEIAPVRSRRRLLYTYGPSSDTFSKQRYPQDALPVGKWAKNVFGPRSSVMAVFMTHAILNDNCGLLNHYVMYNDGTQASTMSGRVPITLKHFQMLARLGRTPNFYLWNDIEDGAEFYMDEKDYISKSDVDRTLSNKVVKSETPQPIGLSSLTSPATSATLRGKKRPRRSAAVSVRSYAIPDSDDEDIAQSDEYPIDDHEEKVPKETNLQLWIKHLSQLLKEETRKYNENKRRLEKAAGPETKVRVYKNEFLKSLATNLRTLRKTESENRLKYQYDPFVQGNSEDEDDAEYTSRRGKRRRVAFV